MRPLSPARTPGDELQGPAAEPESPATERLLIRIHGPPNAGLPTLVYLPGLHGDWTLVTSFRAAVRDRARFVEFTYPRTTTWSLQDYADAITATLLQHGVNSGWLLGESFGSQIAWPLLARELQRQACGATFQIQGIILAGGFVQYPWPRLVGACARLLVRLPPSSRTAWLRVYAAYARFRHRHAPETLDSLHEFIERRTLPDLRAAVHRLHLLAEARFQSVARACPVPVYYLAGIVDPIVPFPLARHWLRRHCPAYRGGRTLWRADHNVLGTAPQAAAGILLDWIRQPPSPRAP